MLHDARSAGTRMPFPIPTTPLPATKTQTNLDLRRRRKTVSIVPPDIHDLVDTAPTSRLSKMEPQTNHQREPTSPTVKSEHFTRRAETGGRNSLVKSKSSSRLPVLAIDTTRSITAISGDPRDTGKDGALTFADTTTASTTPSPALVTLHPAPSSSSPSSPSHFRHPSSQPTTPRLPQSRFSFEYDPPLRKIALTSHLRSPSIGRSTAALASNSAPRDASLYHSRRTSVPDFRASHVETQAASDYPLIPPIPSAATQGGDSGLSLDVGSTVRKLGSNAPKRRKSTLYSQQSPPDVKRRMPSSTATFGQGRSFTDENGNAVKGSNRNSLQNGFQSPIADDPRSKNEDIFLNIARSDSSRRESLGRSELRRSRLRTSGTGFRSSASRLSSDLTPSPDQLAQSNSFDSPLHPNSQSGSPSTRYSSLPHVYSASAHPLEDDGRSPKSNFAPSPRSMIGLPRSRLSRVSPEDESSSDRRSSLHDTRSFRHSTLSTIRSSRQVSGGSEATEKPHIDLDRARQDGTESTLSTTAPSTVWDELEDLKSRIKKLELTGKLPPSSQEAMTSASGERPRTAATTVTTLSSSPRRRRTSLSGESDTITASNPVHPLLQSALVKARNSVSREVYTALEATATDAVALSQLLGSGKTPSGSVSIVNGYSSAERQSRRKADSVCRSLTELCLTLSDEYHAKQQSPGSEAAYRISQPNGTDDGTITPTVNYRKSISQDPEITRRQSVTSRFGARRASLANHVDHHPSPENSAQPAKITPSPGTSAAASRLSRLSVSMRTKRLHGDDELPERRNGHARSISRSMTDIGAASSSQEPQPRQRSFGYQAVQPVADQSPQPRTPSTSQSSIPLRRSFMTPSLYTPAIPRSNIQAGSRRYGLSAAVDGPDEDVPLSPREASQTKIVAPSSKLASSYTPISQNRFRTNSLSGRRFGTRQRPVSTVDYTKSKSFNDSID
ncbi:hypothetical protein BJX61DRAFT_551724 [Aspergillus egyptiacus]|nr:hypothetical protein BJX61DRAFT_551724 [Aspergillus egyptiacus]